jgi:hypothetical protein
MLARRLSWPPNKLAQALNCAGRANRAGNNISGPAAASRHRRARTNKSISSPGRGLLFSNVTASSSEPMQPVIQL